MTLKLSLQNSLGIKVRKLGKAMLVIQKKGPVILPTNVPNTANSGTGPLEWEKLGSLTLGVSNQSENEITRSLLI